jgi:RHS repeat-associated protein
MSIRRAHDACPFRSLDNRIGMDENGTQTWTLYDSGDPIMDFNSSGSLTTRYLWGPTGIVARQTSGGTISWYLADALGTVRDLINNSGAIIDHVDFSAFGTVLGETSPTSGDRMMGFSGLERETVTGLNLALFREENPGTGRWDSQDPLGFGGGESDLYEYVADDASNMADPSGLEFVRGRARGKGPIFGDGAEGAILKRLAQAMNIRVGALKPIRDSALWKGLANAKPYVQVEFNPTDNEGAPANTPQGPMPILGTDPIKYGFRVRVDPTMTEYTHKKGTEIRYPNEQTLLYAFVHELIHAALLAGCELNFNGQPLTDKWHPSTGVWPDPTNDLGPAAEAYAQQLVKSVDIVPIPGGQRDGTQDLDPPGPSYVC